MAYMSQEKKKQIHKELKQVLKDTGIKFTLGVDNHSSIVMNIKSGPIDFIKNYNETVASNGRGKEYTNNYMQVNTYWYKEHFTRKALDILSKIVKVLNNGNHDNSDAMSDYHDVGWYVHLNIGKWDKPYVVVEN